MIKHIIIFILPITIICQKNFSIESFFKKSGIFLNDLTFNLNSDSLNHDNSYKLKLDEIKISLSNFKSNTSDSGYIKHYQFNLNGPDLKIKNILLNRKTYSTNWIIAERIKLHKKRESIPKTALIAIQDAVFKYEIDNLKQPESLDILATNKYIDLKGNLFADQTWSYHLDMPNNIIAKPTKINPYPLNKIITYDWKLQDFISDPKLDSLNMTPNAPWNYNLKIENITHLLKSIIDIKIDSSKNNLQLQIQESGFLINELIFEGIPNDELSKLIRINIPNFKIDLSDIWLESDLSKSLIIHKGKIQFNINNLEIKIPPELKDEPQIQKLLNQLGIWNNALMVKKIKLNLNTIDKNNSEINLIVDSPALKIDLFGGLSTKQELDQREIYLTTVNLKINPVSLGLKTWIENWEKKYEVELKRINGLIILDLEGPIKNPSIKYLQKPLFLFMNQSN